MTHRCFKYYFYRWKLTSDYYIKGVRFVD